MIENIIKNIEQCDDFHNRCDYLLEHDEATYLVEYIRGLENKIKRVTDHCYQQIFDLQIGWFPQDMYTTTEVGAKHKVYNEILNLLEDKNEKQ